MSFLRHILPLHESGPLATLVQRVCQPFLLCATVPVVYTTNLIGLLYTYTFKGGFYGLGYRETLPEANVLLCAAFRVTMLHIVIQVPGALEKQRLQKAIDDYLKGNGYKDGDVCIKYQDCSNEERREPKDVFNERFAYKCSHMVELLVLQTKTQTYFVGLFDFVKFDGTSGHNFFKAILHGYKTGQVMVNRQGSEDLDLHLDPAVKPKLNFGYALYVTICESWNLAWTMSRWMLARESLDLIVNPRVTFTLIHLSKEETAQMLDKVKSTKDLKPFVHIMSSVSKGVLPVQKKLNNGTAIFNTQLSMQQRIYIPKVARNLCGHWLISLVDFVPLTKLADTKWLTEYYTKLRNSIDTFDEHIRYHYARCVGLGFGGMHLLVNARRMFWSNNYGLRHFEIEDNNGSTADGGEELTYHWSPQPTMSVGLMANTVTLNGQLSLTLLSNTYNQEELDGIGSRVRDHMLFKN